MKIIEISGIENWLLRHRKRLKHGDNILPLTAIAKMAGISRQTLYAVLKDERTEFGAVAQIKLSRAIIQISSEPSYQHSKVTRIDLSGAHPRIRFGV